MASILKHLRSSTADKRPTASGLADGQIAINTASGTPAMFFKDNAGNIVKIGPAHVGNTAPNATPAGSAGNSEGELWIDENLATRGLKYYDGTTFINLTPSGTTSTVGLVELATDAETQAGTDNVRVVTPSGLQSKISDSTSTTSSTTIASSTAVKSAYDLANAALPKSGGTLTGQLLISPSGSLVFEGSSDDSFETTIAVTNPTADHTITFPNVTGNIVTTGDSGTVTSTMIADGTIVDADINAAAAIAHSKLANITAGSVLLGNASNVPTATALSGDVTINSSGVTAISAGVIVNADVNASAAIAGTKISPDFGSQTITTTGVVSAALGAAATPSLTFTGDLNTGIYSPGADQVAISTGGSGKLFVDASGNVGINVASPSSFEPGARNLVVGSGSGDNGVSIYSGTANQGIIYFADGTTTAQKYTGFIAYDHSANAMRFGTNDGAERLRITSTGALNFVGAGTPGSTQAVSFNGSAPVNSMTLDSSGRLGVGTSSPSNLLEIDAGSSASVFRLNSNNATYGVSTVFNYNGSFIGSIGSGKGIDSVLALTDFGINSATNIDLCTNYTRRVRIDSTGRVGIGTSSPGTKLEVFNTGTYGTAFQPSIYITNSSSGGTVSANTGLGAITWATDSNATLVSSIEAIRENPSVGAASALAFRTGSSGGGTERVRITSAGNVGIGTTTVNSLFEARGTSNNQDIIQLSNSVGTNDGDTTNRIRVTANGNSVWANLNIQAYQTIFTQNGNERARIDSSGRLLVGTSSSSAAAKLIVQGNTTNGAAGGLAQLQIGSTTPANGAALGRLDFSDSAGYQGAWILGERDGGTWTSGSSQPGRLVFSTTRDGESSPKIALFIDKEQYVSLYGQAGSQAGTLDFKSSGGTRYWRTAATTTDYYIFNNDNSKYAQLAGQSFTGWTFASDARLKENIEDLDYGMSVIKQIKPRRFNFIDDPNTQIGFIAQELQEAVPEAVTGKEEEYAETDTPAEKASKTLGVTKDTLIPVLVKALQEAIAKIETLEAKVAALESPAAPVAPTPADEPAAEQ